MFVPSELDIGDMSGSLFFFDDFATGWVPIGAPISFLWRFFDFATSFIMTLS